MILKIKSTSSDLSHIIMKNPFFNNGVYCSALKNGVCIGRFVNDNEYQVLFHDSKYSYTSDNSNQLDYMSHCSPNVVLDIINLYFRHLLYDKTKYFETDIDFLNKKTKDVDIAPFELNFDCYINSTWIDENGKGIFSKYFGDNVEIFKKIGYIYNFTIKSENAYKAFNLAALICMLILVVNPEKWYLHDSIRDKYIRVMENIDVPYFIIYLFKCRVMNREQFAKYAPQLNQLMPNLELTYGNTHDARKDFIKKHINLNNNVLDYGCGEGEYFKAIGKHLKDKTYYLYDIEDFSDRINHIAKYIDCEYVFSNNLEDIVLKSPLSIILSEVIEHNDTQNAKKIIEDIIDNIDFEQLIITTVNKDFNENYELDNNMRHDDHKFEMTQTEFKNFIENILKKYNFKYKYHHVGDCVNGISPTQAFIIEKK